MSELRDTLERLVAPPPRAEFHDELWDRLQASERATARRWRAAAIVATALAVAATSAAGVLAFGSSAPATLDRTISCPAPDQGGVNVVRLNAQAKQRPIPVGGKLEPNPAIVFFAIGPTVNQLPLISLSSGKTGYSLDHSLCTATREIPLARSGLPLSVFRTSGGVFRECWVAPRITIRLRARFGSSGVPLAALLAVRSGKRQHPVAYIDWTPRRVTAYLSPICHRTTK